MEKSGFFKLTWLPASCRVSWPRPERVMLLRVRPLELPLLMVFGLELPLCCCLFSVQFIFTAHVSDCVFVSLFHQVNFLAIVIIEKTNVFQLSHLIDDAILISILTLRYRIFHFMNEVGRSTFQNSNYKPVFYPPFVKNKKC